MSFLSISFIGWAARAAIPETLHKDRQPGVPDLRNLTAVGLVILGLEF